MPKRIINIALDIAKKDNFSKFEVKQFDSITLDVKLLENGLALDVTGSTVKLYVGVKNEMYLQDKDITINGNSVVINVDKNILSEKSVAYAEIELTDSKGTVTSSTFTFKIVDKIGEGATIPGAVEGFIEKYQKAIEEFKKQTSNVVSDLQTDYDSLKKVIIDENASANLQNQINEVSSELEHNTNSLVEHIQNHPGSGGSSHEHTNKSILDGITSSKVNEWNNKSDAHTHPYKADTYTPSWNEISNKPSTFSPSTHRHNVSEIDGLSSGGEGDFVTDWRTIQIASKPQPTNGGFPTDFNNNFINYGGTYWVAFHNDVDFNSVKVKLTSNKLIATERIRYKYTTSNGTSWSEYTDTIELYINQGLNNINNSSVDLYDNDLVKIRNKDNYGEVIGEPIEVSMVNGTTNSLDEYMGVNAQVVVDTEKKQLRIMDGVTKGGTIVSGEGNFSGDYNDLINKPTIPSAYTLPTATTNTLGGVKIGSGINISNGVISVTSSNGSWIGAKSVLDFGAQPLTDTGGQPSSSAFDNTSAIQQAINWSNDNRATVYFPRGRYVVKGTLYLKDYCSFKGDNQLHFGYEPYGNWNKNDVVFLCENNVVFRGFGKTDNSTSLHQTEIALRGINFQHGDPSDSNMVNSVFFHKLQLNRSDIRDCLFRGFGIWLIGAMFMKTYVQHNIFMEMRKYFIQSLSIPNIGNTAGIIDSRVKDNYISGSQSGLVDNIGFYINYPAFSEISGNFIDFWKWGMDIWNGEATSIRDNDFQYCAKGIRIAGAGSINIEGNRFGKMNYTTHKSSFANDVSRWGTTWHGIDLEDSLNTTTVTNNIGSTIDTLIRMRATTYEKMFVNANMGGNTIVDTQHSNDSTKKIFIQEFK